MTDEQEPPDEDLAEIEAVKESLRQQAMQTYDEADITVWARLEAFLRNLIGGS